MATPKETDPAAEPYPTHDPPPDENETVGAIQADNAEAASAAITTSECLAVPSSSAPTGRSKRSTRDLLVGATRAIAEDRALSDAQEFLERDDATKEQLIEFMYYSTKKAHEDAKWKGLLDRAWRNFLGRQPTNEELRNVLGAVPPLRDEAWAEFLSRKPEARELVLAAACRVESVQDRAWNYILENDITLEEGDYVFLMGEYRKCDPQIGEEALKRYPNDALCCYGVLARTRDNDLRDRAWAEFLQSEPPYNYLAQIMHRVKPLQEQAARAVLAREDADNEDLVSIIQGFAPVRRDAWSKLKERDPSDDNLLRIIECVPSLRSQVSEFFLERHPDLDRRIGELDPPKHPESLALDLKQQDHNLWALGDALPYIVAHRTDEGHEE